MGEMLAQARRARAADSGERAGVRQYWLAWSLFALTCGFAALDLFLLALSWTTPVPDMWGFRGAAATLALAFAGLGQLLARHRPENLIGWLFLACGLIMSIDGLGGEYAAYADLTRGGILPGGTFAGWVASWLWPAYIGLIVYSLLLFPTGRLPSPRWRPIIWLLVGSIALWIVAWMVRPGPLWFAPYLQNPVAIVNGGRALRWISVLNSIGLTLCILAVLAGMLLRLRNAQGIERQQIKWFAYVTMLVCAISLLNSAAGIMFGPPNNTFPQPSPKGFQVLTVVVFLAIPLVVGLAIQRYRLYDIDRIINHTLVYGTLSAGVVVTYILIVGLFGTLVNANANLGAAIVTAVLAALSFRPLRTRLQRRVDRVIYGGSDSANAVRTGESQARSTTLHGRLAWSVASLSLALAVVGFAISVQTILGSGGQGLLSAHVWFSPMLGLTYALVGALVASRQPRNPIGWICSAVGFLSGLNLVAFAYGLADAAGIVLPGDAIVYWLGLWVWIPVTFLPLSFLLLLFPDGHLLSARWRLVGWSAGLAVALNILGTALSPNPSLDPNSASNPFGISGAAGLLDLLVYAGTALFALGSAGSVVALVVRLRRSRGIERAQIKWLAYAGILGLLGNTVIYAWGAARPPDTTSYELMLTGIFLMLIAIAAAAGMAILRYQLYEIDLIVNRALVYGALTAGVVALYILLVGALSAISQTTGNLLISLLATGLIAFLFQPLRERLQRGVNRLLYGERDEPYALMARLGQDFGTTGTPDSILPALVRTIAQALKLPYVAIETGRDGSAEVAAAYGEPAIQANRVPLAYQGETLGHLLVAPRSPNEQLSPADLNMLRIIGQQAGMALHAVELTADLQRSRERLVVAREEERRRIRRDLHDGLGPVLASLAMEADNAREWSETDPKKAEAALADIAARAQAALQDIRRLVYDLRPPALDELGLVGALRQTAANSPNGVQIEFDVPEPMPGLPAAVEVAAYRISQETLNNVLRHSHARRCAVRITVGDELRVEIYDDGLGLPSDLHSGVGLISMRERAAELGGSCVIESQPGGGTRVLARLPLSLRRAEDG